MALSQQFRLELAHRSAHDLLGTRSSLRDALGIAPTQPIQGSPMLYMLSCPPLSIQWRWLLVRLVIRRPPTAATPLCLFQLVMFDMSAQQSLRERAKQWVKSKSPSSPSEGPRPPVTAARSSTALLTSDSSLTQPTPPGTIPSSSSLVKLEAQASLTAPLFQASSPAVQPLRDASASVDSTERHRAVRAIASFRTLLSVSERALDGLPVWGPKAVVGAAADALKIIQVSAKEYLVGSHQCNLLAIIGENRE
jgi:hypothetical protein